MSYLWTSECVSKGHPDKVADQISDAILDATLRRDPQARVACETLVTKQLVVLAGEINSADPLGFAVDPIVRQIIKDIGYEDDNFSDKCQIINNLHSQSKEIYAATSGLDAYDIKAGDQGMMFGYATNATPACMPLTIYLSRLVLNLIEKSKATEGFGRWILPDAKSQVTVEFNDGKPKGIDTIVVSLQHIADLGLQGNEIKILGEFRKIISSFLIDELSQTQFANLLNKNTKVFINPAGLWTFGGPAADTGLTGRKLAVDNYGSDCQVGGGAFSGKDCSKVDRSGAYAARYVAKNLVKSGICDTVQVQVSYAIGFVDPVSVRIDTQGTSHIKLSDEDLSTKIFEYFPMQPGKIIKAFNLFKPIFLPTARIGHFGNDSFTENELSFFSWEKTDLANQLASEFL